MLSESREVTLSLGGRDEEAPSSYPEVFAAVVAAVASEEDTDVVVGCGLFLGSGIAVEVAVGVCTACCWGVAGGAGEEDKGAVAVCFVAVDVVVVVALGRCLAPPAPALCCLLLLRPPSPPWWWLFLIFSFFSKGRFSSEKVGSLENETVQHQRQEAKND